MNLLESDFATSGVDGQSRQLLGFSQPTYREPGTLEAPFYQGMERRFLYIYHKEWWGIRSATELLPGWSLAISAYKPVDLKELAREVVKLDPTHVIFHGYSQTAADAGEFIHQALRNCEIHVVAHVSAAQFDNQFEIDMLAIMLHQQRRGVVQRLWSVKPGFSKVCGNFEDHLLINTAPAWAPSPANRQPAAALIPLTRGLRKNMHANHIALCRSSYKSIFSSLESTNLQGLVDDRKIIHLGHIPQSTVLKIMSSVGLVSNVTLIECQPMVFNEAMAVGTPCLTGPLHLPFCQDHRLRTLTEVAQPDDVALITTKAEEIKRLWEEEPEMLPQLCMDYHRIVQQLSAESYATAFGGV